MPSAVGKVSKAEAVRRLRQLPLPVLNAIVAQVQDELQQERIGLVHDQEEWFGAAKRLAESEKQLAMAQKAVAAREERERKEVESLARTERLLNAAERRRAVLEAAIKAIQKEVAQIATPPLPSADVDLTAAEDVQHINTAAVIRNPVTPNIIVDRNLDVCGHTVQLTPSVPINRAAAAAEKANLKRQCAAAQHAKEQQVLRLERENRLMQRHIEVLRRGDASSASLYRNLAASKAV
jgi:hypothetical protein